jgi:hypothetical protein
MNYRQEQFVNAFTGDAECMGNATAAAARVGYRDPENSGRRLLRDPAVAMAIQARLDRASLDAEQVLRLLWEQAQSSMADFLKLGPGGLPVPDVEGRFQIDLARAYKAGKLHLVKRLIPTKHGMGIELHDAQRAAELLGKALGLWRERLQIEASVDLSTLSDEQLEALVAGKPALALPNQGARNHTNARWS